jgi:hypothetical protein
MSHRVRPTRPKIQGRGNAGLWVHLGPGQRRSLPTPRLNPVPGLAVGATFATEVDGGATLLLSGPLVTYSALRESFWGQRRSLGLWVERCLASSRELRALLQDAWGIDAELQPDLRYPGNGSSLGLRAPPEREILFYSRRGGRLLGSRIALAGRGRVSLGGRGPTHTRALWGWCYTDATVEVFDPGREYDI